MAMNGAGLNAGKIASNATGGDYSLVSARGVACTFSYEKVLIGDSKYETRLCLVRRVVGDRSTVLKAYITEADAKRDYPEAFAAFTQNAQAPSSGTPLSEIPGLTNSQISRLHADGIESIEDLLSITRDEAAHIGRQCVSAWSVVQKWQKERDGNAGLLQESDDVANMAMQLQAAQSENADMAKANDDLRAELAALKGGHAGGETQGAAPAIDPPQGDADGAKGDDDPLA